MTARSSVPMPAPLLAAYVVFAVAAIVASQLGWQTAAMALKGIPVMLLLVVVAQPQLAGRGDRFLRWLWLGLAAGMVGDVVIEVSFVGGLVAFLVGHIFYLIAMGLPRERPMAHLMAAVPALAVWITMMWTLVANVAAPPQMHLPLTLYMTVITLMMARAWGRGIVAPAGGPQVLMLIGATLFVVSDGAIAMERWVIDLPFNEPFILGTYYLAQLLISRAR